MKPVARRVIAAATILGFLLPYGASAASKTSHCFNPGEIEADQAVRYQAELMVVSDTCGTEAYRNFTVHNRDQIVAYQHALVEHFKRDGVRSPQTSLENFMTQIANEFALQTGRELRQVVCTRSADFLAQADSLGMTQFRLHIAQLAAANADSYRRCK
ncbi:MAG TPA: hypothetical protein VL993_14335 [Stellaceae bacterium]|nr:hypothetical protein [Stellaceae bacterium]